MNPTQLQESIIKKLGLADMAPEDQGEMLIKLGELIFKNSLVSMVERMDAPTRDAFAKLMEGNPSELDVQLFLEENVPDAKEAVAQALIELEAGMEDVSKVPDAV